MNIVTDLRTTLAEATPVYAAVGVADLIAEKLRSARAQGSTAADDVRGQIEQIDLTDIPARAQQLPTLAVSKGLELAGKAEETYGDLAARGEKLVDRISSQRATQDLIAQGKVTVSRGKAAVTTVRKAAVDTRTAAKATLTVAEREGGDVAADLTRSTRTRTTGTKAAAKRTTTTARKRTATARSTTKSAATSARKTATKATKAAESAATKVGG
jgi:heparin binding hemagglutinin HbhA